jgi:GH25 family lysozyme M1 (1,4-beta-N-acetylmuramidase)
MALHDIVIDVSDAQGRIDWLSVAGPGIKVAIVKATERDMFTASTWHANPSGATAAGIKVVPYHFIGPGCIVDQIAHFQSVVGWPEEWLMHWIGRAIGP